jgi:hypothetical protein
MQTKGRLVCLFGLVMLFSASAFASPLSYAIGTSNTLYSVDLATAIKTAIGPTGVSNFMEGLALSPGNQLFSTDFSGNLYSVSTTTGAATTVGSTGRGNIEGLAYDGSSLLGISFSSSPTIFSINTATAATTNVVNVTGVTGVVRAMTVLDSNDVLVADDSSSTFLRSINLTTGVSTLIGTLGPGGQFILAMAFGTDGRLYALGSTGNEYIVNTGTAALTTVGNTGGDFWLDMTSRASAATPEPATVGTIGISLLVLAKLRRRFVN